MNAGRKYSTVMYLRACKCMLRSIQLFATPGTIARQAPLSMKISRQEYWSELQFPTPVELTTPGIEPMSLVSSAFAGGVFTTGPPEKPHKQIISLKMLTVLKNISFSITSEA